MTKSLTNPIVDILLGEDEEPEWVVPDLFLRGSLICLGGEAGAGKSFVAYTIALAAACGARALGGIVPAGPPKTILYFDDENAEVERNKYLKRAWVALTLKATDALKVKYLDRLQDNFWPLHFSLGGNDWPDQVQWAIENVTEQQGTPHMMVFDTASSCFNIQNENDNGEAGETVKLLRHLMALGDPTITALVLKHAKIRSDRGRRTLRGAKQWIGMADAVMFQVKAAGRPRKDGLSLTRLEPDKTRAYGLNQPIYITPNYTDDKKSGLFLDASYSASKEHKQRERQEDADLEDEQ